MRLLTGYLLLMLSLSALAAPKADLWPRWEAHDAASTTSIDHGPWTTFLQQYLDTSSHPYRLDYAGVSKSDRAALDRYVQRLEDTAISEYSRDEQMPYWINLYNAVTVQLVLENYPVKSITKIKSGFFSFGPWDRDLVQVEGEDLTLNDIEHRILRPIWQDPRIHYAVNCASISCPNLAPRAYTAVDLEAMLEQGARDYVNDPRGAAIENGKLIASTIYDWYQADFGGTEAGVIEHLKRYAEPQFRQQLENFSSIAKYRYDWALNDQP